MAIFAVNEEDVEKKKSGRGYTKWLHVFDNFFICFAHVAVGVDDTSFGLVIFHNYSSSGNLPLF